MKQSTAMLKRAYKTLIQSAIGSAATAILAVIGTSTTIGEVNWGLVASTAVLAMIVSMLMNVKANLPELENEAVDVEIKDGEE